MSTILKPLVPLEDTPGFADAFARAVSDNRNTVCEVCGLGNMGHAPESEWLGFGPHRYTPIRADRAMLEHAERLTSEAYRLRRESRHVHTGFECGAL